MVKGNLNSRPEPARGGTGHAGLAISLLDLYRAFLNNKPFESMER